MAILKGSVLLLTIALLKVMQFAEGPNSYKQKVKI